MNPLSPHPLDQEAPPSIVINPHSELGRELRRWEQHYTHLTPPGTAPGNPYTYRAFPKMVYKAHKRPNGKYACMVPQPQTWDFQKTEDYQRAILEKDAFDTSCQRIVRDEAEYLVAKGQGWADDPQGALTLAEQHEQAIANASAEAIYAAQRMSEQARAEFAQAEAETSEHVTDVAPKKRGRPRAVTE